MILYSYKKHEQLNTHINKLNFLVVEIVLFPIFIAGSLVLLPVAYIKICFIKLRVIGRKLTSKSKSERVKEFWFFLLFGYLQLLANTIADAISVAGHLFMDEQELQRRSHPTERF